MALGQRYLETGQDKVEFAIDILRSWEPPEGYYLAFSGGKDSTVLFKLAQLAGVKFDAHYCVSPIDPPQIYKHIKTYYPDVIWDYHARGFWQTVIKKDLPRRQARWCCQIIKESGGKDRVVALGNRHAESSSRSRQCFVDPPHRARTKFARKMNRTLVRPILHFTDYDVWEFIRNYNLPYCCLYDEGAHPADYGYGKGIFKRLGCILCPFTEYTSREEEYFPKIVANWKMACNILVAQAKQRAYISKRGKPMKHRFENGEELFNWWISRRK